MPPKDPEIYITTKKIEKVKLDKLRKQSELDLSDEETWENLCGCCKGYPDQLPTECWACRKGAKK